MALEQLIAVFRRCGVEAQAMEAVSEALSLALNMAGARDLVCVTGSLFVVAEAIEQVASCW
jgi:folylpolyglutamate synthase/dihydropteroate synthase